MDENNNNLDETLDTSREKSQSDGSRLGNAAKEKAKEQAKKQTKKAIEKSAKTAAKAGAKASKMSGLAAFLATPAGWACIIIVGIIVLILMIIGAVSFFTNMPGLMTAKLTKLKDDFMQSISVKWNETGDITGTISEERKIELAQYVHEMGYDLVGYGFVDNVTYYTEEDDAVKNGEKQTGDVKSVQTLNGSDMLFAYIFADQRIYTMKIQGEESIKDAIKTFVKLYNPITSLYTVTGNILNKCGVIDQYENFGEGMLNIEFPGVENFAEFFGQGNLYIDGETKTLTSKVWNPEGVDILNVDSYEYGIEGWVGRYGTPLELSLTMHLATMSPDFVYDWLNNENLQTVVNIKLDEINYDVQIVYEYTLYDENNNPIADENGDTTRTININQLKELIQKFYDSLYLETSASAIDYINGHDREHEFNEQEYTGTSDTGVYVYNSNDIDDLANMLISQNFLYYKRNTGICGYYSINNSGATYNAGDTIYVKDNYTADSAGNKVEGLTYSISADQQNGNTKLTIGDINSRMYYTNTGSTCDAYACLYDMLSQYRSGNISAEEFNRYLTDYSYGADVYIKMFNIFDDYIIQAKAKASNLPAGSEVDSSFNIDNYANDANYNYTNKSTYYQLFTSCVNEMQNENANSYMMYEKTNAIIQSMKSDLVKAKNIYLATVQQVDDNEYGLSWKDVLAIAELGLQDRTVKAYQPRVTTVQQHWFKDVDFRGTYGTTPAGTTATYEYVADTEEHESVTTDADGNVIGTVSGKIMVIQTTTDDVYVNKDQPFIIKGDVVTQNGKTVENYNGEVEYNPGFDYSFGDGYKTTKKIFTQGMYYQYDSTETTANEIKLAKQIEKYAEGTKIAVKVENHRIISVVDYSSNTDDNIGKSFESSTGGTTYIITAPGPYKSPIEVDYATSKASADKINKALESVGSSIRRVPVTFDNETALTAFAILEGTHTLDAEYIYRDLKELIIDLGYFTKAEFESIDTNVLEWFIPSYTELEWPPVNDEDTYQYSSTIKSEKSTTKDGDETPGFTPGLDVIAPGGGTIKSVTVNSVTIEFDIEQDQDNPEAEIVNKWTLRIQGINPSVTEGQTVERGAVIGTTTDSDIKVLLRDSSTAVVNNIEDYMEPPVFVIENDYNVCTNGGINVVTDIETFNTMFYAYPVIRENAQAFMDMQEKYKVNAVFAACVTIVESSGGTNGTLVANGAGYPYNMFSITHWSGTIGTGNGTGHFYWTNSAASDWCAYSSYNEAIMDFGNYIGNNPSYYFLRGEYKISEIAKHYCNAQWGESVSTYMTQAFERAGLVSAE